jgi:hypothetical protein
MTGISLSIGRSITGSGGSFFAECLKITMKQQNTANKIFWLRVSYWVGAIVDFIFAIALIFFPGFTQFLWQLDTPIQGTDLMWTKYFGTMVFAWTCTLLWADRKPLERKGVLLLTCVPVIIGLVSVKGYAIIYHFASPIGLGLIIGMLVVLFILFLFSYRHSTEMNARNL